MKLLIVLCLSVVSLHLYSGEYTLQKAVETAVNNNRNLHISVTEVRKMQEIMKQQRAAHFPTITFSTQYTRLSDIARFELPMAARDMGARDNYEARLSLKYLLFAWWSVTNTVRMSNLSVESSRLSLRQVKEMVVYSTTMAFYRALLFQKVYETKVEALQREKDHLQTVQQFVSQGRASRFDLLKARVQMEEMSAQVLQSKNDYEMSINQLRLLLGSPLSEEIKLKGELKTFPVAEENHIRNALKNRAEIAILKLSSEILQLKLRVIDAENKPRIYLFADGYVSYPYLMEKKWGFNWLAGIKLEINVFDGMAVRHRYNTAEQELRQNETRLADAIANVRSEVQDIQMDLSNAKKILAVREKSVALAEEALNIAKVSYKNGVITNLDVLNSELSYTNARLSHLEGVYKVILGVMNLKKATGTLLSSGANHG